MNANDQLNSDLESKKKKKEMEAYDSTLLFTRSPTTPGIILKSSRKTTSPILLYTATFVSLLVFFTPLSAQSD